MSWLLKSHSRRLLSILVVCTVILAGCSSPQADRPSPATARETTEPARQSEARDGLSLYERRLMRILERERALKARAMEADDLLEGDLRQSFQRIAREYESVIADNPREVEPLLLYGKFLDWFGDRDGARDQFITAYRLAPETAVVQQQLGVYFAEEGDFGRALAHYLRAIELEPEQAVYHADLGELLYAFSPGFIQENIFDPDTIDAMMLEAFREAARLEPGSLVFQYRLGEAYYDVDNTPWKEALDHWENLQQRDDLTNMQRDAVRLHRARCLHALRRHDEAETVALDVSHADLQQTRNDLLIEIRVARED
ncbi:MAG: hypothetical protein JJU00_07590 [Opitutales bacterium]|nr:hypothetical protein [Opitutales bacterium]